jgi:hypothetical protein
LWLTRNDSLIHLIVVGFWNYEIQKRTNLLFRDEKGLLSKLIINSSNYIIDEKEFDAPELKNKVIEMNSGPSNMYGGIGSTGIISLKLPVIPEKHVELILKGEAINIQNQKQPFSISVKSEIITRSETIPFYKYFYWKLTAT